MSDVANLNLGTITPSAMHKKLDMFVGTWSTTGQSFAEGQTSTDPRASSVPWISQETYAWLPGGYFMIHEWDAKVGAYAFKGTEIIGYDLVAQSYYSELFDNSGNRASYQGSFDGSRFELSEKVTRMVTEFSGDGSKMEVKWEWLGDNGQWLPLCERNGDRHVD